MTSSGTSRSSPARCGLAAALLLLAALARSGNAQDADSIAAPPPPPAAGRATDADSTAAPRTNPAPATREWQTGLLREDRIQHASLSWTIGLGTGLATGEPAAAFAAPAVLGLAKEVADRGGSGFDGLDLAADLLGALAAALLTTLWKN